MRNPKSDEKISKDVIESFGYEWQRFSFESDAFKAILDKQFLKYTRPLNFELLSSKETIAADFGAGSGRWAERFLAYVKEIYVVEPSLGAQEVLKRKFGNNPKVKILSQTIDKNQVPDGSLDLAISLGVLHHLPDTQIGLNLISTKIKPGGIFLCYIYYNLENRTLWYKLIFRASDFVRRFVSRMPHILKLWIANLMAIFVYLPLSRISRVLYKKNSGAAHIPLNHYKDMPLYVLRNDALDRFGTRVEHRFSRIELETMLENANFDITTLVFSNLDPYYTFSIFKKSGSSPTV